MNLRSNSGFSMVELAISILVLGLLFTFSVPALNGFNERNQLKTAVLDISAQLRLAREKAIATGQTQLMHFAASYPSAGTDYHIHNNGVIDPKWGLPKKVTYYWGAGTYDEYHLRPDGRCQESGMIILQDSRGNRDTVSVQTSGLILTK